MVYSPCSGISAFVQGIEPDYPSAFFQSCDSVTPMKNLIPTFLLVIECGLFIFFSVVF